MNKHRHKATENQLPVNELLARAHQGDADCQYWAGVRYLLAEGVPEDAGKAFRLCQAAAVQGHAKAQAFVGYCYSRGVAVPLRPRLAVQWYRRSARQGYVSAEYSLGTLYLHGKGVKKNIRLAVRWLDRAAAQGDADAQLLLGRLYHAGDEVVRDDCRAFRYFRAAAEHGKAEAEYMTAEALFHGEGVDPDPLTSFVWLDRAAAKGFEAAVEIRERFDGFVSFDPAREGFGPSPVDNPVPVRLRTVVTMKFLGRLCLHLMARDIHDYVGTHPEDADAGYRDIARLLEAARNSGEPVLPFVA